LTNELSKLGNGRRLEKCRNRKIFAELLLNFGHQLHGDDGMAAQIKKIVIDTNLF